MASSGYEDITHQEAAFVESMLDPNPKGDKIIDDVMQKILTGIINPDEVDVGTVRTVRPDKNKSKLQQAVDLRRVTLGDLDLINPMSVTKQALQPERVRSRTSYKPKRLEPKKKILHKRVVLLEFTMLENLFNTGRDRLVLVVIRPVLIELLN